MPPVAAAVFGSCPCEIAAGAFNVVVEAVRGGLDARGELAASDPNPFGKFTDRTTT